MQHNAAVPIIDIQIVGELSGSASQDLARRLADALGATLGSRELETWVKVQRVPREAYAENGGGPLIGVWPVFAAVLQRRLPSGDALVRQTSALTAAIARECQRDPAHVHILYQPAAAGRMAFGGTLVE